MERRLLRAGAAPNPLLPRKDMPVLDTLPDQQ